MAAEAQVFYIGRKIALTREQCCARIEKVTGRKISPATLSIYRSRGTAGGSGRGTGLSIRFPEPNGYVGRTPLWFQTVVDEWAKSLPGRGAGGGRPVGKPAKALTTKAKAAK
jgi:hypothetical protein